MEMVTKQIGAKQVACVIGGSMGEINISTHIRVHTPIFTNHPYKCLSKMNPFFIGGMQALEWTLLGASLVKSAVIIGCGARHSAWQIAISSTQRQAIFNDPKWHAGHVDPKYAQFHMQYF